MFIAVGTGTIGAPKGALLDDDTFTATNRAYDFATRATVYVITTGKYFLCGLPFFFSQSQKSSISSF